MFDETEDPREKTGDADRLDSPGSAPPDAGGEEGAGRANADATPKIGDEGIEHGQTANPAPDEDVGVPEDEGGSEQ